MSCRMDDQYGPRQFLLHHSLNMCASKTFGIEAITKSHNRRQRGVHVFEQSTYLATSYKLVQREAIQLRRILDLVWSTSADAFWDISISCFLAVLTASCSFPSQQTTVAARQDKSCWNRGFCFSVVAYASMHCMILLSEVRERPVIFFGTIF